MSMEPSNKSKTTKSITRMSRQGTTSSDEKTTTVVSSSHKRKTQTTKSPDSKTVQQTTLKEGTTIVVTSSHKSETTGTILSTKRPTQLSKIYVRQSDFEDSFMEDVRLRCDDIEKTLNDVLQACRKLIDKRFVKMKNKRVWYDRDVAALYPKLEQVDMPYCLAKLYDKKINVYEGVENFDYKSKILIVDGVDFVLASPQEGNKTFRKGNGNPYLKPSGEISNYKKKYGILSDYHDTRNRPDKKYNVFIMDDYYKDEYSLQWHDTDGGIVSSPTGIDGLLYDFQLLHHSTGILMIMISRLGGKNSSGLSPVKTLFAWLQQGLVPEGLSGEDEKNYNQLLTSYKLLDAYLDWDSEGNHISFRRDSFMDNVRHNRFRETIFQRSFDLLQLIDNLKTGKNQYQGKLLSLRKKVLECDYWRANLEPYADTALSDINKGHWELFEAPAADAIPLSPATNQVWTARPPQLDVVANGTCAIDFGTKSSVVVCRGEGGARLLRVGTGTLSKAVKASDYENPTVVELRDLESFATAYHKRSGRPFTKWADVTVAHQAEQALLQQDVDSSVYYAVFSELKQWAHEKDRRLLLKDRKGKVWKLKPYLELNDDDLDPIEIYAYYLGLYINNMRHGIYLDYILSFPVNYDLAVRTKLLKSFERGLKKSLPPAILADEECMDWFLVYAGASEPAAYAAAALQAYGLEPAKKGDITAYGVFDFGGGTTDFDFGIEKMAANPRRHKFEIHQFGRGGDPYLGGENILNVLAFEVYCDNLKLMREKAIPIALPHGCTAPAGTETLILAEREATQISYMNRKCLAEALRPIWEERPREDEDGQGETWSEKLFTDGSQAGRKEKKDDSESKQKEQEEDKNRVNVELTVNVDKLKDVIRKLISRGVTNFFEAWKTAFKHQTEEPDTLHILLAGNSCRSSIVKELFEEQIKKEEAEVSAHAGGKDAKGMLILHMPLGFDDQDDGNTAELDQKLTGKTGVAFGLLRSRKGGKDVKIVNDNVDDSGEALFPYFLGDIDVDGNFCVRVGQGVPYHSWAEFCYADEAYFEIYYTAEPQALEGKLPQKAVKYVRCRIDKADVSDDDDRMIFLRKVGPDAVEYAVGTKAEFEDADCVAQKHIIRQTLR